jgi:SSS family solute:Na+ symporter
MILSTLDYSLIGFYFLFLLGLGLYLRKKASASMEDYFLGGRNLPWWALGVSNAAGWFSISGSMIIIAFLFMLGPRGLFVEFRGGACLLMIIPMLWAGKWHRRSQCITGAEFLMFRFGNNAGGKFSRIAAAFVTIITTIASLGMFIKGVGLFVSMFVPYTPEECAIVMVAIATVYTVLSGFYGVVYTDIFQSCVILIVVVVVGYMAFTAIPDFDAISALALKVTGTSDWTSYWPQIRTEMPIGGEFKQYEMLMLFAGFYLLRNILAGTTGGASPIYFGAKSDRECGKLTFFCGSLMVTRWVMMIGFAILGLYLVNDLFSGGNEQLESVTTIVRQHLGDIDKSQWANTMASISQQPLDFDPTMITSLKDSLGSTWQQKMQLVGYEGTVDPERILPAVVLFSMPDGLRGLIIITMLAAFMSTFDTVVNTAAGFFSQDLYRGFFRKHASNKELMWVNYSISIVLVIGGLIFGFYAKSINDVWGWIVMGLGGGLVPSLLMFYWWRFTGGAFAFATIGSGIAAILQRAFFPDFNDEIWLFISMMSISFTLSLIGTALFHHIDRENLKRYFNTVKPFGFWAPLMEEVPKELRAEIRKDFKYSMLALPFGFFWLVSLYLWPMLFMLHHWSGTAIVFSIFIVSLIGLYQFWWKRLPE